MAFTEQKKAKIKLNLGFIGIEGEWDLNDKQRDAAWEIYVELVTRISVVETKQDEGILREALTSLYSLFGITRDVLRNYGPVIAKPVGKDNEITLGYIAVGILNKILRPLLSKWHPLLSDHEEKRPKETTQLEHEKSWKHANELRKEIKSTREKLSKYADVLAEVAGVSKLH